MTGQTISKYRVGEKLGEGGMGAVYLAEDTKLKRVVALKFLNDRERFLREAQAVAALNHANICTIFEVDEAHGFIAMELLEGKTLKEKIAERPLPLPEAIDIALQICAGLQHAHDKRIVHRDIKPANIIVSDTGAVKIMDFGLAQLGDSTRITKTGTSMGTPAYMSPEQVKSGPIDRRTDLWSLGVTLYEMISGRLPFPGETDAAVSYAIANTEPEPLTAIRSGVPMEIDRIVAKLLRKQAEARYANAEDLQVDLRHADTRPAKARTSRRPLIAVAGGAVVAAAIAAGAYWSLRTPPIPSPSSYQQLTAFSDSVVQPSFSPDGRMVTFIRGTNPFTDSGQIYVKLLPDGEPVQLTRDPSNKMSPVFSPDGTRIVYTVRTLTQWDSWVVPVLGGEPRPFLPNASGLVWTAPDRILFSEIIRGIHMKLVTARESRAEVRDVYIPPQERGMAHRSWLSPDGKWVLFAEMAGSGWLPCRVAPFDGSHRGHAVGPPGRCMAAAWSPDGRWMYFTSDASSISQVWRQRFPDGVPVPITQGPADATGITMSPSGDSLVTSIGIEQSALWLGDKTGERQLTNQGFAFLPDGATRSVFSPDGTKAYFLLRSSGSGGSASGELSSVSIATGATERILPGISMTSFDISNDGKTVAYTVLDAASNSRIWIAPLDRSLPPRELPPLGASLPAFETDDQLYFCGTDGAKQHIYSMRLEGGAPKKILPDAAIGGPKMSPDGNWMSATFAAERSFGRTVTLAIPLRGGEPVTVCAGFCVLRWFGDGALFVERVGGAAEGAGAIVPMQPGRILPPMPAGGLKSVDDFEALPGARAIQRQSFTPGPNSSTYLFVKRTVQRNLYRLPLE